MVIRTIFLHIVESFNKYTRLSLISKYIKAIKLKGLSENKINIYVYDIKQNGLYHFHTHQLISLTQKDGTLDKISDKLNKISDKLKKRTAL